MENDLAALRLGSPLRFRDRWEGRLYAFEVDEGWEVINLLIRRGLLWGSSVRLPFAAACGWSEDHIAFDCASEEAFGRQLAPVAAPGRILSGKTALTTAGAHLVGALVERATRRASHLLVRRGVAGREHRAAVEQLSFEDGSLRLAGHLENLSTYRSDDDLRLLVRDALARQPYLTADDRRALAVEVSAGVVRLAGNVRTRQAREWAERAAASVDGAVALRNEIVDDIHLEVAVAQALERAGLVGSAAVYVRSFLGELTLSGYAPSTGTIEEIVRTTARVPGVRSVTNRLELQAPTPPPAAGAAAAEGASESGSQQDTP